MKCLKMLILLTELRYFTFKTSRVIKVDITLWNNKLRTKQLLRLLLNVHSGCGVISCFSTKIIMTNSKQGNVKEIFLFWKHTKRNEKINETTNRLYILISCSIWRDTVVQLINALDFVFLCVAVWLCTIENQSLKQRN